MVDRSFAASRSRSRGVAEFPARPVLPRGSGCNGLLLIDRDGRSLASLRPLRDDIAALWRGTLPNGQGEDACLIVLFDRPLTISPDHWPSALPFNMAQGWTLKSYAEGMAETAAPQGGSEARHIMIWWSGAPHRLVLDGLERVALSCLWDMPDVTIHRPMPLPSDGRNDSAGRPALSRVSGVGMPLARDGKGVFDETVAAMASLDDRTTLKSIGRQLWSSLFGQRRVAGDDGQGDDGQGGDGQGGGEGRAAAERGPGVLANMAGWLLWHTPLGVPLARQFAARMKLVERLMAAGDVDSALRLALRLANEGGEKKPRSGFPARLPGMRDRLDFSFGGSGFVMPILGAASFASLHERYAALADRLEREGDYRRAAYVRSQLQGDHHAAVRTLANGEMFRDAAKLALDAGLDSALAISMFFKAGDTEVALALAKRAECFDQLAEESRVSDAVFHAYVIAAWTERLIATGQIVRALQITDHLAATDAPDGQLLRRRQGWIERAIGDARSEEISPELLGRALLIAGGSDAKTGEPHTTAAAVAAQMLDDWMTRESEDARQNLLDLAIVLVRLAQPQGAEQRRFWTESGPAIIEAFVRALIGKSAAAMSQRDFQGLQSLLKKADLQVFAADIGKLKMFHADKPGNNLVWSLPTPTADRPAVLLACLLHDGAILVWRADDLLQMLDPFGRLLWQGRVSKLTALVPVGASSDVILVQAEPDGQSRLSRFASRSRAFHAIGQVRLIAHHDLTSDGQWMVQIGGQIGAIDLVKLCAAAPEIAFVWSCQLTENLQVRAFYRDPQNPSWITRDISDGRRHLVELWSLHQGRNLKTSLCSLAPPRDHAAEPEPRRWSWTADHGYHRIRSSAPTEQSLTIIPWTETAERQGLADIAGRMRAGSLEDVDMLSCDHNRARVERIAPAGEDAFPAKATTIVSDTPFLKVTVTHGGDAVLTCLARGERAMSKLTGAPLSDQSHLILLADGRGQLVHIDLRAQRIMAI